MSGTRRILTTNLQRTVVIAVILALLPLSSIATAQPEPTKAAAPPRMSDAPDLLAELMPPAEWTGSGAITIKGQIVSKGGAAAATSAQLVLEGANTNTVLEEVAVPALAPGETFQISYPWNARPGLSKLILIIDPQGEDPFENNQASTWVGRNHANPKQMENPFRFERLDGGNAPPAEVTTVEDEGALEVRFTPRNHQELVALVDRDWLDSRVGQTAIRDAVFDLTDRDGIEYYGLRVPAEGSTFRFADFTPDLDTAEFGRGSLANILLDERPMKVKLAAVPSVKTKTVQGETPNGTIETQIDEPNRRLSIDFNDETPQGQPVLIRADWLKTYGITNPRFVHEDGTPIDAVPVGKFFKIQPEHFSIIHTFDFGNLEAFSLLAPAGSSASTVGGDAWPNDSRILIHADRTDTTDKTLLKDFVPHTQYTVEAQFGIKSGGHGHWQGMYPLMLGNRADRTSPPGADNYGARGSMGFFYYSTGSSSPPQIRAQYTSSSGTTTNVWTWTTADGGSSALDNWQVTLRIRHTTGGTYFELVKPDATTKASGAISNSLLPLSSIDSIWVGSEDLDTDSYETPANGWVDSIYIKDITGNYVNQLWSSSSGWTLTGNGATCCTSGYLQLTPNAGGQVGRALYNGGLSATKFSAEFRAFFGDHDGADGLVFMFYKETGYTPSGGGDMGFVDTVAGDSGHRGFGLEFDTYQSGNDVGANAITVIRDNVDTHLGTAYTGAALEDNTWHTINVDVIGSKIWVYHDLYLAYSCDCISQSYTGFGFSAGTGGFANSHLIDYVQVSTSGSSPPPNNPPGNPTAVSPANGATNVAVPTLLDWTAVSDSDGDPVTYQIYFGTSNPPSWYTSTTDDFKSMCCLNPSTPYYWYIVATDNRGGQSQPTQTRSFTTASAGGSPGLNQNFDAGISGWTMVGSPGYWHQTTRRSVSPSQSMWYGSESTGLCNVCYDNGATNSGTVTSPVFTVPSSSPTLTFKSWYSTEGGTSYDQKWVKISTNGGSSWTNIAQISDTMSQWNSESYSLSSYAGMSAQLRWEFNTMDNIANQYEGWYIDDVVVNTPTPNNAPTLAYLGTTGYETDGVNPDSGTAGTSFTFKVRYTDADGTLPAFVRVHVSGTQTFTATMTKESGDIATGAVYAFPTTLTQGSYQYHFEGSDAVAPIARHPSSGEKSGPTVGNTVPTLTYEGTSGYTSDGVQPDSGTRSTSFTFRVKYSDPDGNNPSYVRVHIDNDGGRTMPFSGLGSVFSGAIYTYSTTLPPGNHQYHFEASDGTSPVRLLTSGEFTGPNVANSAPTLTYVGTTGYTTDGVEPNSGDTNTNFVYRVKYTDVDGDAPSYVRAIIDGQTRTMTLYSGSYSSGAIFTWTQTNGVGSHDYKFTAHDGYLPAADLPSTPASGPSVSRATGLYPVTTPLSPTSGNSAQKYTFEVEYVNINNAAPTDIKVYIDGVSHTMNSKLYQAGSFGAPWFPDSSYNDGAVFTMTRTVSAGSHTYYFTMTSDGNTYRLPTSGSYGGPSVVRASIPPKAEFRYAYQEGTLLKAELDTGSKLLVDGAPSSDDSDFDPVSYSWGWGDGTTGTGAKPTGKTYATDNTYQVSLQVSDVDGSYLPWEGGIKTQSFLVQPNELRAGPAEGSSIPTAGTHYYRTFVPTGLSTFRFDLRPNGAPVTADFDIYVKRGVKPTTSSFDAKGTGFTATEAVVLNSPAPGWYYVMIRAVSGSGGYTVQVTPSVVQTPSVTVRASSSFGTSSDFCHSDGWSLNGGAQASNSGQASHDGWCGVKLESTAANTAYLQRSIMSTTAPFAAQVWARIPTATSTYDEYTVLQVGTSASSPVIRLALKDDDHLLDVYNAGAWTMDVAPLQYQAWNSVRITASANDWVLYVNDSPVGVYAWTSSAITLIGPIGDSSFSVGAGLLYVDDIRFHVGDSDTDGLTDYSETQARTITVGGASRSVTSDPFMYDTDGDYRYDFDEVLTSPHSDPRDIDTDDDGLFDGVETNVRTGSNPQVADTPEVMLIDQSDQKVAFGVKYSYSVGAGLKTSYLPYVAFDAGGVQHSATLYGIKKGWGIEGQAYHAIGGFPAKIHTGIGVSVLGADASLRWNFGQKDPVVREFSWGLATVGYNEDGQRETVEIHLLDVVWVPYLANVYSFYDNEQSGMSAMMQDGSTQPVHIVEAPDGTIHYIVGEVILEAGKITGQEVDPSQLVPTPLPPGGG